MHGVKIYLVDGTFDGTVTMSSVSSKITCIRVRKEDITNFDNELDGPGIYLLLVENDEVYVGQTGLDTLGKRILNTHAGNIDSTWHTVLAFKFNWGISTNELLFIENAMCEYVHATFSKCLTTTPAKGNCNAKYRNQHYHLDSIQLHTCENYVEDIKFYVNVFPDGIFPSFHNEEPAGEILHLAGKKAAATAYRNGSKFIVRKGSAFFPTETPSCSHSIHVQRQKLKDDGKVKDDHFIEDVVFNSPSAAAACVIGGNADGLKMWLYPDGQSIKEKEQQGAESDSNGNL